MKQLIGFFASLIFFSCQKECLPEPQPCYFADVTLTRVPGIEYTLMTGKTPIDKWTGDPVEITPYYTSPMELQIRASVDLGGKNIDFINYFSDVFQDSVRVPGEKYYQLGDQSGAGSIWVERLGDRNKVTVRNSLDCASQARLVYNGRDTVLNLTSKQAGTQGGSDITFETTGEFDISFQLLTPCGFYQTHDVLKVSSSKILPIEISPRIGVRKEDCNNIQK